MTEKAKKRKRTPVYSGVLKYFPDALQEVARASQAGNDQHHPDKELHWDKSKSYDHADALARHLLDAGTLDDDGLRHSAKVAWRALAMLQIEIEREDRDEEEEEWLQVFKDDCGCMYNGMTYHLNNMDGTYDCGWCGQRYNVTPLEGNPPHVKPDIGHSQFPTKEGMHPREKKEEQKRLMREGEFPVVDPRGYSLSDYPESNGVWVATATETPDGWDNTKTDEV